MYDEQKEIVFFPKIALVVSNSCRMRCRFCCENDLMSSITVSRENILKIIDLLYMHGSRLICFIGGEPLLSPYLGEYMKKSSEYGLKSIITTADGKFLNDIAIPSKYITGIDVSIHGIGDSHDNVTRVPGSFMELDNAIKKLNGEYNISIKCVMTPTLMEEAEKIVEWCIENNIKRVGFSNLLRNGLGDDYATTNGRLSYEVFCEKVNALKSKYSGAIDISGHGHEKSAQCVLVYSNGDIIITPYFDEPDFRKTIGNLFVDEAPIIFERFKNDKNLWNNFTESLTKSHLLGSDYKK